MSEYSKKGYLYSNFRIFHLKDSNLGEIDFHYHDFHKVLIHLSGNTSYSIEGQTFDLRANDIVFVAAGQVHKPIFHDDLVYERVIVYISSEFLDSYRQENNDLTLCFRNAIEKGSHVLRISDFSRSSLGEITKKLIASLDDKAYANELYQQVLFLDFMIQLNRACVSEEVSYIKTSYSNTKVNAIILFINENLSEDLSVEAIAEHFYLSRYYLMHSFKEETGYTIGSYISMKRLALAQSQINEGLPVVEASVKAGFSSYSSFLRAYKKTYGHSPKKKMASDASMAY